MDTEDKSHKDIAQEAIQVWNEYEKRSSITRRAFRTLFVVALGTLLSFIRTYIIRQSDDYLMFMVFSTILSILLCVSIIYFMALNLHRARKALVSTTIVLLRAREYGLLAEIKKDIDMRLKPELVNGR